ncbi:OPT oligopeptide transporter protein-domain-containing protein [Blyttiomyces helicus]|uniref:OPT oligopeptide transporter protein-domain-containing protein n=1 Tax=Blyttiomyces helicus TaxID=388810 RepID=A0A4P9WMS3_9FUNG|nr:OPT oligopeptide transporter protein-domain-containing protein [Blyttiomyces helicus]|eukprot:RKO92046.1 OPT oligopeptide transporter protein-domain-containing protein [Blyttiomyces helicus]
MSSDRSIKLSTAADGRLLVSSSIPDPPIVLPQNSDPPPLFHLMSSFRFSWPIGCCLRTAAVTMPTASESQHVGGSAIGRKFDAKDILETGTLRAKSSIVINELEFPGEQSAIPEVAATIPTSDDPTLPVLTFRFWFIATIVFRLLSRRSIADSLRLLCLHSQFMYFRSQFINLTGVSAVLMTDLCGAHPYLTAAAYATNILITQRLFYGPDQGPNVPDRWLVNFAAMWWPSTLVVGNLLHLQVFHAKANDQIVADRIKLFNKLTAWVTVYEFHPQYIAPYLGRISLLSLIFGSLKGKLGSPLYYPLENPANADAVPYSLWPQTLGLVQGQGPGVGMLSFDWQLVTWWYPMITPFWAQMNQMIPIIISTWIVAPWMYRKNVWYAKTHDVEDAQYTAYSPISLSTFSALAHGTQFSLITPLFFHVGLFNGKEIIDGLRASRTEHYTSFQVRVSLFTPFSLSLGPPLLISDRFFILLVIQWWGVLFAILNVVVSIVPAGMIQAITNVGIGPTVTIEFSSGLAVPGKALVIGCFWSYGFNSLQMALSFASSLKFVRVTKGQCLKCWKLLFETRKTPTPFTPNRSSGVPSSPCACSVPTISTTLSCGFSSLACSFRSQATSFTVEIPTSDGPLSTCPSSLLAGFYAKRYHQHWYDKYKYTISAALNTGSIVTVILAYPTVKLSCLDGGSLSGVYVYWALNPDMIKYLDQDYCLITLMFNPFPLPLDWNRSFVHNSASIGLRTAASVPL